MRQCADDSVLYTVAAERIDEIAAVVELALEVLPVVGDAERAVAAAQRGAKRRGIAQVAFDDLRAEAGEFLCGRRARTARQTAHAIGAGTQQVARDRAALGARGADNEDALERRHTR